LRIPYKVGRYGTWTLLVLAAIGGLGTLARAVHPPRPKVEFPLPNAAAALAVQTAVDVVSTGDAANRTTTLSNLGLSVQDAKPIESVKVTRATPLDPKVLSSQMEIVPVALWETVSGGASETGNNGPQTQVQEVDVLVVTDGKSVAVGGLWMEPANFITTYSPSGKTPTPDEQTFIQDFVQAWFGGQPTTNDVVAGVSLPTLPFTTSSVQLEQVLLQAGSKTEPQLYVSLQAENPATGLWVPLAMEITLEQQAGHWMVKGVETL